MTAEWDEHRADLARKYLRHIANVKARERRAKADYYERLRTVMEASGISYEGKDMPGNPNAYGDAIPDAVAEADEILTTITAQAAEWQRELSEYQLIMLEDYAHERLLYYHYIERMEWEQVAAAMLADPSITACSASWCKSHHRAALVDMYENMPHTWREPRVQAV